MRQRPHRPGGPHSRARPASGSSSASASATRPSARRAGAGGPGTTTRTTSKPGGGYAGRVIVLSVVLLALGLSYVFPLRVYLAQQAEIAELRAQQAEQRAHVAALEAEAERWADEDYLRTQARRRLYYGEPGEQLLLPVWEDEYVPPETGFNPDAPPAPPATWWDTLWSTIEGGGAAGPPAEPPAGVGPSTSPSTSAETSTPPPTGPSAGPSSGQEGG